MHAPSSPGCANDRHSSSLVTVLNSAASPVCCLIILHCCSVTNLACSPCKQHPGLHTGNSVEERASHFAPCCSHADFGVFAAHIPSELSIHVPNLHSEKSTRLPGKHLLLQFSSQICETYSWQRLPLRLTGHVHRPSCAETKLSPIAQIRIFCNC